MHVIRNSERNNQVASEYETKALLHLLAIDKAKDEISILFIDCFNDLTGTDQACGDLWDVQSKGVQSLRPKTIGESLITLFQNYCSGFTITESILFIPKLKNGHLQDEDLQQFGIKNILSEKRSKVREGLVEEYLRREGKKTLESKTESEIDSFLEQVKIVVANPSDWSYVKDISEFQDKGIYSEALYSAIFREIRDKQTAKKNINIEGVSYKTPSDILEYNKHFEKQEITTLMISRLVGMELFKDTSIPNSYFDELTGLAKDDRADLIQNNNECIARTLFNKNNKIGFWCLLEAIVLTLRKQDGLSPRQIYQRIPDSILYNVRTLDESSVIFFIALIMDGINDEN
ncbi:hypothetical protein ACWPKS_15560 [Coraliomargarita sp. W4R72]